MLWCRLRRLASSSVMAGVTAGIEGMTTPDASPSVTFTAGMGAFTGPGGVTWGSWMGPQ